MYINNKMDISYIKNTTRLLVDPITAVDDGEQYYICWNAAKHLDDGAVQQLQWAIPTAVLVIISAIVVVYMYKLRDT